MSLARLTRVTPLVRPSSSAYRRSRRCRYSSCPPGASGYSPRLTPGGETMQPVAVRSRAALVLLALLALGQSGCLVVAAGVAGGAAAGYCYAQGKVCQTYRADLLDAWLATRTALRELGLPLVSEKRDGIEGVIETRTALGERVRVLL